MKSRSTLPGSFQSLYPYKAHWLSLGKYCLHYLDEGDKNAPAIIMLHGNPTWSFFFRKLIPALSQTKRVIVPDHIGCGLSDKPQNYPYTLATHIKNLGTLVEYLEIANFSLVIHDWGGLIGAGYAIQNPSRVNRLVILNTAAFDLPGIPLRIKLARSPIIGDVAVRFLNLFARLALVHAVVDRSKITPQIKAGYLFPYDNWQNRIAILRFLRDIPIERKHPTRTILEHIDQNLYRLTNIPMLILWGKQDFVFTVDDSLAEWKRRFPQAEVHIFDNAGHYLLEDAAEEIMPLIQRFLCSS